MASWMETYLDAWNNHDGSTVAAFMAEDATYEDLALGVIHEGREAIKSFVDEAEEFSKDYAFTSVSEQQSGDRYAMEWEMFGTNTGEAGGVSVRGGRWESACARARLGRTRGQCRPLAAELVLLFPRATDRQPGKGLCG